MIADTPVAFVAYDILSDGERDLLGLPWTERRACLEAFASRRAPRAAFALHPVAPIPGSTPPGTRLTPAEVARAIDAPFEAARARGFEGLVLKRVDATYEAGRRGQAWLKVKRAFATLDVVITAAEEGHGRRAGVLSDYTFGVWKDERVVDVGKAYSGLTDEEIDAMSARLDGLTLPDAAGRGRVRKVQPVVVLEVAFDGVQPSARHESGYALRFPRIVRIRDDKGPEQADRLETVAALFQTQVGTGHREAGQGPPRTRASTPRRPAVPKAQLNLFGDLGPTKPDLKGRRGG
jgi:DNA ligase-1